MAVIGTCPTCGARAPLDTYLLDAEARRSLATLCERMADYPDVVRRIPGYLSLHSAPGRAASWGKVARLVAEISDLVMAGHVTRNSVRRQCPPALWAQAMDEAQDARAAGSLALPLDGHGWLCQVAWTAAGRAEAQAEANRQALARGETPVGYSPAHAAPPSPSGRGAGGEGESANDLQELISDLRALTRLDRMSPGIHAERIAHIRERLAALGIADPTTPKPTGA
jgi:hypothetical protein